MIKVRNELLKLRDIYLSELNHLKRPDTVDLLVNLFLRYIPDAEGTFLDTHIRKMVSPFGITIQPGTVRIRKFRSKDKWFTWKSSEEYWKEFNHLKD
jgi:hypothetical protein